MFWLVIIILACTGCLSKGVLPPSIFETRTITRFETSPPPDIEIERNSRIGLLNLVDTEMRHCHFGSENSTKNMDSLFDVTEYINKAVKKRLTQSGYETIIINEEYFKAKLFHATTNIFDKKVVSEEIKPYLNKLKEAYNINMLYILKPAQSEIGYQQPSGLTTGPSLQNGNFSVQVGYRKLSPINVNGYGILCEKNMVFGGSMQVFTMIDGEAIYLNPICLKKNVSGREKETISSKNIKKLDCTNLTQKEIDDIKFEIKRFLDEIISKLLMD